MTQTSPTRRFRQAHIGGVLLNAGGLLLVFWLALGLEPFPALGTRGTLFVAFVLIQAGTIVLGQGLRRAIRLNERACRLCAVAIIGRPRSSH